ncbi:MAG: hypothetical protein K940chlam7_00277 [Chlamydiae bacterium]|nr:hypothetical protein [Chlamydiota bacterium]
MPSLELSTFVQPSDPWEFVKQNSPNIFEQHNVPNEIVKNIFEKLVLENPRALVQSSRVCWRFHKVAIEVATQLDLRKFSPFLRIIDEAVWEEYADLPALGLSFEDAEPYDQLTTIQVLAKLFTSKKIDEKSGVTILTIPKGLNFRKLELFTDSPKKGNAIPFYTDSSVLPVDTPVEKTYRIAITNSVLTGSQDLSIEDQITLVKTIGWKIPGILPVATLAYMTYICSQGEIPTLLFSQDPLSVGIIPKQPSYAPPQTRCLEKSIEDDGEVVVTEFYWVCFGFSGLLAMPHQVEHDSGVAVMQKI